MMTEEIKRPRKPIWAGLVALLSIAMSFHLHVLYGVVHSHPREAMLEILTILHRDSFLIAVFAVGLSILCLVRGNRILGYIALVLSIGAVFNSMIMY